MGAAGPVGLTGEEFRRSRRAFVQAHHPDRGGDPVAFAAGLARFDELLRAGHEVPTGSVQPARDASDGTSQPSRVVVVRRQRGVQAWLRHLAAAATRLGRQPPPRVR